MLTAFACRSSMAEQMTKVDRTRLYDAIAHGLGRPLCCKLIVATDPLIGDGGGGRHIKVRLPFAKCSHCLSSPNRCLSLWCCDKVWLEKASLSAAEPAPEGPAQPGQDGLAQLVREHLPFLDFSLPFLDFSLPFLDFSLLFLDFSLSLGA